jgi:hypothetical protein
LLDVDFERMSLMTLYRASDALMNLKTAVEQKHKICKACIL